MPLVIPPRGAVCPALSKEPFNYVKYAYPGTGKSPMVSVLPDHLFVDLQNGSKYFPCRRVNVGNYEEFGEVMQYWRAHPATFLIVDPITTLVEWAEARATAWFKSVPIGSSEKMQQLGSVLELKGREDGGGSPGWMYLRKHFMEMVAPCWARPDTRTIFVGHVRDAMLADATQRGGKQGSEVDEKDLDLPGKLRNIFLSECDLAGYAFRSAAGNTLKVSFAAKKNAAFVKCRCPHLHNRTLDFHTPSTLNDWRQVYPETIERLCGPANPASSAPPVPRPALAPPPPAPPAQPLSKPANAVNPAPQAAKTAPPTLPTTPPATVAPAVAAPVNINR